MSAKILLIEDHPVNSELMRYLLDAFNHRPIVACNGEEGLEAALVQRPELILCDIHMPGIDGFEVLRRLRADECLRGIPVVAITALAMVGDSDMVLCAGFDGYLSKPIEPETFVQQVEAFLPQSRHSAGPTVAEAVPTLTSTAPKRTILAVDDIQVQLDLIVGIFEPSGYRVVTTANMLEALRIARQTPPDLILSDIAMHEGSGYDLITAVKAHPRLKDIPFVFLTSTFIKESDRAKGLALGANRFLFRPIEPKLLLEEVQACLLQSASSGQEA